MSKTIDEQYKEKLYAGYTSKPRLLLSRDIHRLFHDVEQEGYVFFMQNFVEDVGILVGKNMPALCDKIADEILNHLERSNEPNTDDNAAQG